LIDLDKNLDELEIDDIPPSLTPEEKQATVGLDCGEYNSLFD